jgi:hypothetical protein
LALSVLTLSGCGGGGDDTAATTTENTTSSITLTGVVSAPSGQVASLQKKYFFKTIEDLLLPSAVAMTTGLSPVTNATVSVFVVNNSGVTQGDAITTATTSSDGSYSLQVTELRTDCVVVVNGSNNVQIRAPLVSTTLNINPATEFATQQLLNGSRDLTKITVSEVSDVVKDAEAAEVVAGSTVAATVSSVGNEVGDSVNNKLASAEEEVKTDVSLVTGEYHEIFWHRDFTPIIDTSTQTNKRIEFYSEGSKKDLVTTMSKGNSDGELIFSNSNFTGSSAILQSKITSNAISEFNLLGSGSSTDAVLFFRAEASKFSLNSNNDITASWNDSCFSSSGGDTFGLCLKAGSFKFLSYNDSFIGLTPFDVEVFVTADSDGDGTQDTLTTTLEEFAKGFTLQFLTKKSTNFNLSDHVGNFGHIYFEKSFKSDGTIQIEVAEPRLSSLANDGVLSELTAA